MTGAEGADASAHSGAVPHGPTPIFILSFRQRDELAEMVERAGWKATAARRSDGAERRFIASGATVAVVDARGAFDEGLAAVRLLADTAQINASALLALVSRNDVAGLDGIFAAGATHYLASPFGEQEFAQMLRFAERHAERLAGGYRAAAGRAALLAAEQASWRWRPGDAHATVSASLAQRLALPVDAKDGAEGQIRVSRLLRALDHDGRRAARQAVDRLLATGRATAFAHGGGADDRIAHHLHFDVADDAVVGRIEDIEALAEQPEPASRDPLTGLDDGHGARRWIEARLRGRSPDKRGPRCVLLMLSISRFDMVNAAFGRGSGDALLQGVARRIERMVAEESPRRRMIARIAGAEFAIGLSAPATTEEAVFLASQLAAAVARPFVSGDHVITLACRVGVASAEEGDSDAGALLRRASAALADAKTADAGAVRVLDATGEAATAHENRLEIDLRLALDQDEIGLLFQPQVSVTTGKIVGVEALARWRHPRLGELGAVPLFAAAERSDYLMQLSAHVQKKAIRLAAAWPKALSKLRLAVNVTAADIAKPDFAEQFLAMVDEIGFDRGRLTVEVTESGLIEDLNAAAGLLATLRAGGLRVAIDDFGTGYSSLAYLKALPLDYLKIDRRLSQDIAGSARDRVVVRGVIEMARSLGLSVIAEGVETEEQLSLLAREGCNYYQGFLCSPPISEAMLERLVGRKGDKRV
jgi:diguanylate cyclase (GGDEF)-like protein